MIQMLSLKANIVPNKTTKTNTQNNNRKTFDELFRVFRKCRKHFLQHFNGLILHRTFVAYHQKGCSHYIFEE